MPLSPAKRIIQSLIIAVLMIAVFPVIQVHADNAGEPAAFPTLSAFSRTVSNSSPDQITGVYVKDKFALPVLQQPAGQAGYVSTTPESVTQFAIANRYNTIGLLAHNYLAGAYFSQLSIGNIITLIYGDGEVQNFRITAIKRYQALSPNSPYSNFIDLSQPGITLSSNDLFYQTYGLGNVLILQTCIAQGNESSWGRLFVIAEPIHISSISVISVHKRISTGLSVY